MTGHVLRYIVTGKVNHSVSRAELVIDPAAQAICGKGPIPYLPALHQWRSDAEGLEVRTYCRNCEAQLRRTGEERTGGDPGGRRPEAQ